MAQRPPKGRAPHFGMNVTTPYYYPESLVCCVDVFLLVEETLRNSDQTRKWTNLLPATLFNYNQTVLVLRDFIFVLQNWRFFLRCLSIRIWLTQFVDSLLLLSLYGNFLLTDTMSDFGFNPVVLVGAGSCFVFSSIFYHLYQEKKKELNKIKASALALLLRLCCYCTVNVTSNVKIVSINN